MTSAARPTHLSSMETGRNIALLHNPCNGWSYSVMIPSWVFQSEPGSSENNRANPVVFYRIQVGIQFPEGVTTSHVILRRFSDFLKLFSDLKHAFPRKNIPQSPPKHSFLRINSSRLLIEERRYALEEWMGKLLSDIDIYKSLQVATFLELESAARTYISQNGLDSYSSNNHLVRTLPTAADVVAGSLSASVTQSAASDCGSDSAYETSETCLSSRVKNTLGMNKKSVQDLCSPDGNFATIDSYSVPSEPTIEHLGRSIGGNLNKSNISFGDISKDAFLLGDGTQCLPDTESEKHVFHARKLSSESVGSGVSSLRGSEHTGISPGDTFVDISESDTQGNADTFTNVESYLKNGQIFLPLDQRHILNKMLVSVQKGLVTARTDMEDLMARMNKEITAKEYLITKVNEMEAELESTRQQSKENLHQAIMSEREKVTQMQWELDDLRRKSQELESRLKFEQDARINADFAADERNALVQELHAKEEELVVLKKHLEDIEYKSKSDIKVLSKEVKSLRNSQMDLKEKLSLSMMEKIEQERSLHEERRKWRKVTLVRRKLLHECATLRRRLQECSVDFLSDDELIPISSFPSDALEYLATSDSRICLLLAEAQLLADEDSTNVDLIAECGGDTMETISTSNGIDSLDDDVRKMLAETLIDNAKLRRQINSVIRSGLRTVGKLEMEDDETIPRKTIFGKIFDM